MCCMIPSAASVSVFHTNNCVPIPSTSVQNSTAAMPHSSAYCRTPVQTQCLYTKRQFYCTEFNCSCINHQLLYGIACIPIPRAAVPNSNCWCIEHQLLNTSGCVLIPSAALPIRSASVQNTGFCLPIRSASVQNISFWLLKASVCVTMPSVSVPYTSAGNALLVYRAPVLVYRNPVLVYRSPVLVYRSPVQRSVCRAR
ncbi:hypothetical protein CDAR_464561 [Caerostris darwini]|uniref:Uncharacterized protein n=1 Tax=Caerostris darwini TaxID=1538125 RepID=A0AAV4QAA9_9ARAC|nr:hypothetical protein CDAR_464561 [Caerostris darwini]